MQFIFYLFAAIILLFFFISTIIGVIRGGSSFFDSFKKGFKFLLVASIILAISYYIFSLFANLKYNPNGPNEAYEELKRNGFDLLSARPYYLLFILFGFWILLSDLIEWLFFGIIISFSTQKNEFEELKIVNKEKIYASIGAFLISFLIFSFSADGLYFKDFTKYLITILLTLSSIFYSIIYISYLANFHSFLGKTLIPKLVVDEINSKKHPKLYAYFQLFGCFLLPTVLIYFMFLR